jgi:hypothetical protein
MAGSAMAWGSLLEAASGCGGGRSGNGVLNLIQPSVSSFFYSGGASISSATYHPMRPPLYVQTDQQQ